MDPISFLSVEGNVGAEQAGGKDCTNKQGQRAQHAVHSVSKTPSKFNAHQCVLRALSLLSFWMHTLS